MIIIPKRLFPVKWPGSKESTVLTWQPHVDGDDPGFGPSGGFHGERTLRGSIHQTHQIRYVWDPPADSSAKQRQENVVLYFTEYKTHHTVVKSKESFTVLIDLRFNFMSLSLPDS